MSNDLISIQKFKTLYLNIYKNNIHLNNLENKKETLSFLSNRIFNHLKYIFGWLSFIAIFTDHLPFIYLIIIYFIIPTKKIYTEEKKIKLKNDSFFKNIFFSNSTNINYFKLFSLIVKNNNNISKTNKEIENDINIFKKELKKYKNDVSDKEYVSFIESLNNFDYLNDIDLDFDHKALASTINKLHDEQIILLNFDKLVLNDLKLEHIEAKKENKIKESYISSF